LCNTDIIFIWNINIHNSQSIMNGIVDNLCDISIRNHILLPCTTLDFRFAETDFFNRSFYTRNKYMITVRNMIFKNNEVTGNNITHHALRTKPDGKSDDPCLCKKQAYFYSNYFQCHDNRYEIDNIR